MHTPPDVAAWTSQNRPGKLITETLQYDLTVYKSMPSLQMTDSAAAPDCQMGSKQEEEVGRTPGAASSNQTAGGNAKDAGHGQHKRPQPTSAPGPWDGTHAVWTKDRDTTGDDLQPAPALEQQTTQEGQT